MTDNQLLIASRKRAAHQEAIAHFSQGLRLLEGLPETPEYIQRELDLQIALGMPLVMSKGHAAPEVG